MYGRPLVASTSPVSNATNVSVGTAVTAVFNEAMNAAYRNSSTIELRNGSNALVPASISYNAATYTAYLNTFFFSCLYHCVYDKDQKRGIRCERCSR
ncbi:MAG: Ig-like domain-containing protein [Bacteroidota bacterium]